MANVRKPLDHSLVNHAEVLRQGRRQQIDKEQIGAGLERREIATDACEALPPVLPRLLGRDVDVRHHQPQK